MFECVCVYLYAHRCLDELERYNLVCIFFLRLNEDNVELVLCLIRLLLIMPLRVKEISIYLSSIKISSKPSKVLISKTQENIVVKKVK